MRNSRKADENVEREKNTSNDIFDETAEIQQMQE